MYNDDGNDDDWLVYSRTDGVIITAATIIKFHPVPLHSSQILDPTLDPSSSFPPSARYAAPSSSQCTVSQGCNAGHHGNKKCVRWQSNHLRFRPSACCPRHVYPVRAMPNGLLFNSSCPRPALGTPSSVRRLTSCCS